MLMPSAFRAGSGSAVLRAKSVPSATPANTRFPSWGCALACSAPSLRLPAIWLASRMPHPVSSTHKPPIRSSRRWQSRSGSGRQGRSRWNDASGGLPGQACQGLPGRRIVCTTTVTERHRHRYEVNNAYRDRLEQAGLRISGTSPDGGLVEFVELDRQTHPYFVATQAHPELKSRPTHAHPLFAGLVAAAVGHAKAASKGAAKESSTKVADK